jgi:hypothetical protein
LTQEGKIRCVPFRGPMGRAINAYVAVTE